MYAMITGTYFYTDALMTYIREEIELKKIPYLLDKVPAMASIGKAPAIEWTTQWLGWETNMADRRPTISRRKILCFFSWGIILISAIATGYSLFLSNIHIMIAIFLALVIVLVYGSAIEYIRRKESFLERYKKKSLTQL